MAVVHAAATRLELERLSEDLGVILAALSGHERYALGFEFWRMVLACLQEHQVVGDEAIRRWLAGMQSVRAAGG